MSTLNADRSTSKNDYSAVKKFKRIFDATKAFKIVFYSAALVSGSYDAKKFDESIPAKKVLKSKPKTWYV